MRKLFNYSLINIVALSVFIFVLNSCEYSPSEIPFTELEEPPEIPPTINIELTPEMDTLRLSAPIWVTYSVDVGEREIYSINPYLDGKEISDLYDIYNDSPTKIRIYIHTDTLTDGVHHLSITTYTSTNSSSIAEKTGNEAYWYEITWPVFVNKHAKDNFGFYDLEFVTKGIKVSWPQYTYADFDHYEFSWCTSNTEKGKIQLYDPLSNFYIDSTYVEGCFVNFSISITYTTNGYGHDNLSYYQAIESPEIEITNNGNIDVCWKSSKNEKYVKSYYINSITPNYGVPEEHDITNLNDTSFRLDETIGFGGDYQVRLRYIPKGFDNYYNMLNTVGGVARFALGDTIPRFQKAYDITAENSFLLYNNGVFSKYDLSTTEILNSISVPPFDEPMLRTIVASPDGNYFGHFINHDYVVRQSSDLSVVNTIDIGAYSGYNLVLRDISISSNGLICTADYDNILRIFNSLNGELIFESQINTDLNIRNAIISPDGENLAITVNDYLLHTTSLIYYAFDGTHLTELGRVNEVKKVVGDVLAFAPQNQNKLIISHWGANMYEYEVEARNSRTFELIYSVKVPKSFVPVSYDFTTDHIIARFQSFPTKKYSYLINLKNGNQEKIVQFTGKENLIFKEGIVYSGNGRSIDIQNFIIE